MAVVAKLWSGIVYGRLLVFLYLVVHHVRIGVAYETDTKDGKILIISKSIPVFIYYFFSFDRGEKRKRNRRSVGNWFFSKTEFNWL